MDRVVRKFSSHEEAEKAEREYYRSLSGEQRLQILLELLDRGKKPEERGQPIAKVYKIVKFGKGK